MLKRHHRSEDTSEDSRTTADTATTQDSASSQDAAHPIVPAPFSSARSEARSRFGGIDFPAVLAGTLAALGLTALLSALLASLGIVGYSAGTVNGESLGVAAAISGLVVLVLALLLGGWVAGRMARFDGGRNGLLVALVFVLLTAGLGGVAAAWGSSASTEVILPTWLSYDGFSLGALLWSLLGLVVVFLMGFLGGKYGERWHKRVDRSISDRLGTASTA